MRDKYLPGDLKKQKCLNLLTWENELLLKSIDDKWNLDLKIFFVLTWEKLTQITENFLRIDWNKLKKSVDLRKQATFKINKWLIFVRKTNEI